ncbi:hypothetical protein CEP88_19385 [Roseobacter denitrificans]|uniref:Uncharacterized protein n=1 Tax=Roseobacter denitrificans (strain ATCC 33942 / OCh 114) TaxID=375451 RepID=Q168Q4_ROSDO|nr:hypothetical protein [Roseobacter denitrificans]ABG31539.1 hypothetical protein RD1_1930 [Roseobacter denitrificans OCh 114]AVL54537.1 hypothetical protein CEP88_19385 [Roseobacter denitrificans]SFF90189.1 hypothetical protein SAMN05443635_103294 [Roseobacter denitrificans OCh 114]
MQKRPMFIPAIATSLAIFCADLALAAEPMDGQAFDAYTRGKTLFYGQNGEKYGAEVYLDDRRVKWSFLDGQCKEGFWYEEAGQICFVYEDNPTPQCWAFTKENGRLSARFENLPGATELYEAEDVNEEMICLGPDVGV